MELIEGTNLVVPKHRVLKEQDHRATLPLTRPPFPFSAIVGQGEMKLALLLNAIDPSIGRVALIGHRETGQLGSQSGLAGFRNES